MASAVCKLKLRVALAFVALSMMFGSVAAVTVTEPAQAAQQRKLIIGRVVFENNKKLNDAQLSSVIDSKPQGVYSPATVQTDIEHLKEVYSRSGRSTAVITARTVPVGPDSVDLVFTIGEGVKVGIEAINFVGNDHFSAWRLKRQLSTVESGWLSWLRTTDTYDPDRLSADEDKLRRFYANHGYPDFKVVSVVPALNAAQDGYVITVTVDEGQYYKYGPQAVQSTLSGVNGADYERRLRTSPGYGYRADDVDKTVEAITDDLARTGHPFAQVRPRGERDGNGDLGITYVIEEGAKVYIERINIRGNTRTRDYVIRREFDVAEGDPYNKAMIDRAARRLRLLGYFESVRITNEPGSSPDRVVIDVDVVDQSTGEFSVGGGYSTNDGFLGEVSLSERNFLGRGQYVKVAVQYGQKTKGYQFSFTEPYFLGQRIAAGFDLFSKNTDASSYTNYNNKTIGATLRATFPITEEFSIGTRYSIYREQVSIENCSFDKTTGTFSGTDSLCDGDYTNGEASKAIGESLGSHVVSLVGYTLAYNSLDDSKNPTQGIYATFKQDFAGLGGDAKFIRTTVDARYYYPLMDDLTVMVRGQGGHIMAIGGDKLRIVDQFNMGPDLVRGFAPGGIGPRDIAGGSGNSLGGRLYYGGSAELQFPILGLPREVGLSGAVFADAGTLYDYGGKTYATNFTLVDESKIRSSIGASLLWASPLGPLRFDYGYALTKAKDDRTQAFHFGTWTAF